MVVGLRNLKPFDVETQSVFGILVIWKTECEKMEQGCQRFNIPCKKEATTRQGMQKGANF